MNNIIRFIAVLCTMLLCVCAVASAETVSLEIPENISALADLYNEIETEQHYYIHDPANTAEFVLGYLEYLMQQDSMTYACMRENDGWVYHMFYPAEGYEFSLFEFNSEALHTDAPLCAALFYTPGGEYASLFFSKEINIMYCQPNTETESPGRGISLSEFISSQSNSFGESSGSDNSSSSNNSGSTCSRCRGSGKIEKNCSSCGGDGIK